MDWVKILQVHVAWKKRLLDYLEGRSEETLAAETIRCDDRCELGQWIYGPGQQHRALPAFEPMRAAHAEFHRQAAEVVTLVQAGDRQGAKQRLLGGYSQASQALKRWILRLQAEAPREQ